MKTLISLLAADVSSEMYEDPFPIKVTDMSKLFQTMEFTPEKIQIPFEISTMITVANHSEFKKRNQMISLDDDIIQSKPLKT